METNELGLFTDLYELTMLRAYVEERMDGTAVFTLFVRRLPEQRNFLLACGVAPVLAYLEQLRWSTSARDERTASMRR
jgi:nicotinate phosphoribosyltransferase